MKILHRLWRQEQYYTAFLGGFAAMPLTSGIIKRFIRFIRNKYKIPPRAEMICPRGCCLCDQSESNQLFWKNSLAVSE
ncbi:MAG: hypothetical protein J6K89_08850 [Oscillospiraceae bacterium]|nr:hypothetical protein [Oscillospiraceae bacterium]